MIPNKTTRSCVATSCCSFKPLSIMIMYNDGSFMQFVSRKYMKIGKAKHR